MPRLGIFARVDSGGTVRPGDRVEAVEIVPRETIQAVVLTISDRCSCGQAEDTAGPAAGKILNDSLGANIYRTEILPDEKETIAARLKEAQNTAAILTTFNELDMSAVVALRKRHRDSFEKRHGVKLGFM